MNSQIRNSSYSAYFWIMLATAVFVGGPVVAQTSSVGAYLKVAKELEETGELDVAVIEPGRGGEFDTLMLGFDSGALLFLKGDSNLEGKGLTFSTMIMSKRSSEIESYLEENILRKTKEGFEVVRWTPDRFVLVGFVQKHFSDKDIRGSLIELIAEVRSMRLKLRRAGFDLEN